MYIGFPEHRFLRLSYLRTLCRHSYLLANSRIHHLRLVSDRCFALARYLLRRVARCAITRTTPPPTSGLKDGIAGIDVLYINLASRVDRKEQVLRELAKMGFTQVMRVHAVRTPDGHRGATFSHQVALRYASWNNLPCVLIVEDDAEFLCSRVTLETLISDFLKNCALDILAIGHNTKLKPTRISSGLSLLTGSSSAGCYLVKHRAYEALDQTLTASAARLGAGEQPDTAAFDQLWKRDQTRKLGFACPNEMIFRQRLSFSDTQGRVIAWPPIT